jgi:FkbM family methyltransferase
LNIIIKKTLICGKILRIKSFWNETFRKFCKKKFIYTEENNFLKKLYFIFNKFLKKSNVKKSYSIGGIDLLLNYLYKNKFNGVYIDVGCNHPIDGNNTFLLYQKGWSGINVDLDSHAIKMFNYFRPKDYNANIAVSNSEEKVDLFFYHERSTINTISKNVYNSRNKKIKGIKKIQATSLDSIIKNSPYSNKKINLLSIDVEGNELNVLKGFDLKKYYPEVIVIEYLDLVIEKLEFYNQNIDTIINSEIYKYLINFNYHLVNWVHSDLVFVNNEIRN